MKLNKIQGFTYPILLVAAVIIFSLAALLFFTGQKPAPLTLNVDAPEQGLVVSSGRVTVKGKTSPNAVVAIYSEKDENTVESDEIGNFEGEIALSAGINDLSISAFSGDGQEQDISLEVVNDETL